MKHKSNNIKVFILTLVLLAGLCLCTVASAETHSGSCGANATWTLDDVGKLTISGTGEMTSSSWSSYRNDIKTVVIELGITNIAESAFYNCSNLKSVSISGSVKNIGDSAFRGCSSLPSLTIPSSINTIERNAFRECTSLSSFTIPDTVTKAGDMLFYGCTGLKTATIQAKVSNIVFTSLFLGCSNLTEVSIPANHQAYSSRDGVVFDKAGKTLLYYPQNKNGPYSVPSSVTKIANSAFSRCSGLTGITLPDGLKTIGRAAFLSCGRLTNFTIPSSVREIGETAFYYCSSLTNMTIPEGITIIPYNCFCKCVHLTKITFPRSLECIGPDAFTFCDLDQVTLYARLREIGEKAFDNNVSITAPEGSYAAQWARNNRHNLTTTEAEYIVTIQYKQDQGNASASPAYGKKGAKVTLKASPKKGFLFSGWSIVSGGVKIENNQFKIGTSDVVIKAKFKKDPSYASVKGAEYKLNKKKKTAVYLNPTSKTKTSITIPATINVDGVKYQVTEIATNAFKGCSRLKKVTIGKNITRIGKNAFKGCKTLATITIKTTKLTKKGIGSNCFKSIASKPTFKCPKKQKNDYKTWIVKTGKAPKKSKFK